ncbi:MAG TPA: hypothetical protein VMU51_11140 [Mycobacteriales bacterium]|nr:hypothetical protein [Mycobacteriales bacterium]
MTGTDDPILLFASSTDLESMEYVWVSDQPPSVWPAPNKLTIHRQQ